MADATDRGRWDRFVAEHPLASVYHSYEWLEVVQRSYRHQPSYLMLSDDRGELRGVLPTFLVKGRVTKTRHCALPCAQYAYPLVDNQVDCDALIAAASEIVNGSTGAYFEVRTTADFPFQIGSTSSCQGNYVGHRLDLTPDLDTIRSTFHKSCISRAITKSEASGLELHEASGVAEFYRLYSAMRRRNGLLSQPLRFFESLWTVLGPKRMIEIKCATLNGRPIAAIVLMKHATTVYYEYGASAPGLNPNRPSHFLLWHAIKEAKQGGATTFDFGRTAIDNLGLLQFKRRWGTHERILQSYFLGKRRIDSTHRDSRIARKAMQLFVKVCPPPVSHLASRLIYRDLV